MFEFNSLNEAIREFNDLYEEFKNYRADPELFADDTELINENETIVWTKAGKCKALVYWLQKAAAYDQVKWERDVAFQQLEDLGTSFGEKPQIALDRIKGDNNENCISKLWKFFNRTVRR